MFTYIKFNHPNMKDTTVYLAQELAFSFYWSEAHKATHIMGPGGAIMPVAEKPETVLELLKTLTIKEKE